MNEFIPSGKLRGSIPVIVVLAIMSLLTSLTMASCDSEEPRVTRIAFGSCGHEDHPLPVFNRVVEHEPDYFIFLGDNIYGDTEDMDVLRKKYAMLGNKPSFQQLKENVQILATWDDHDYGWNDIGRHYPFKKESKEIFLSFFEEPFDSERRNHEGIYHAYFYQYSGYTLQIIMLDNRTFRDDLLPYDGSYDEDDRYFYTLDYAPHSSRDSTLLGETQWDWLEKEFLKPADIRIICSGSQFGIEYNGYESWANFPHEQERMLELIKKTGASGVFFITGDVHYAEISKLEYPGLYPIYDFTSSGLSSTWHFATPNINRIEGPVMDNHFGLITIEWVGEDPSIRFEVWDVSDNQRVEYTISLSDLQFN